MWTLERFQRGLNLPPRRPPRRRRLTRSAGGESDRKARTGCGKCIELVESPGVWFFPPVLLTVASNILADFFPAWYFLSVMAATTLLDLFAKGTRTDMPGPSIARPSMLPAHLLRQALANKLVEPVPDRG